MSETDPGRLPTSKMELAVTILTGSPKHDSTTVLEKETPAFFTYYPRYCYYVNSSISSNSPQPLISLCF